MLFRLLPLAIWALAVCVPTARRVSASEHVVVVIGKNAPELERFAARELAAQWKRLFDAEVTITSQPPNETVPTVWIGRPQTNPAIESLADEKWPKVSDQGIVLRSVKDNDKRGLLVGGGSPQATLWAVYELGSRFGVRYLTRDDIYPNTPIPLKLDGFDVAQEPLLRTRDWQISGDSPRGYEAWPLQDQKRLLGQLAKLKFNRVTLTVHPWQPFVHYEFRGVKKNTAALWYGETFAIPRDAPGRTALGGFTTFVNPDFAAKRTYEELTAAGVEYVRGLIGEAHRLGMTAGLTIRPLEFPREFAAVIQGAKVAPRQRELTIASSGEQGLDDPSLRELVATKIRAYLNTYPTLDAICLDMPELQKPARHAERAWQTLVANGNPGPNAITFQALMETAPKRKSALQSDLVTLAFFKSLFESGGLLKRPNRVPVRLVVQGVDPALFPWTDRILPRGSSALHSLGATARRAVGNRGFLAAAPADKVRSRLVLTLSDDKIGVLSQSATGSLEALVGDLRKAGWDGFSTRAEMLAELDPSVYFLSQAAWDPNASARKSHDALFTAIAGKQSIADRLWLGLNHMEAATNLIDQHDRDFAFPAPDMLLKHYRDEPAPKWWGELQEHYTQAMVELYRAHSNAHPRSRKLLFYWAKRSEYVLEYLNCVKALREAALARKQGDNDKTVEQFETAIEQLYNALDTLSDVARDPGDRGLIAVLIAYAYRPLIAEYEKAANE